MMPVICRCKNSWCQVVFGN